MTEETFRLACGYAGLVVLFVGPGLLFLEMLINGPYRREQRKLFDAMMRNLMKCENPYLDWPRTPRWYEYQDWMDRVGRDNAHRHNVRIGLEYDEALEKLKAGRRCI